jgi:long-subunit acyl-CoA synthetase (AMP-forming)
LAKRFLRLAEQPDRNTQMNLPFEPDHQAGRIGFFAPSGCIEDIGLNIRWDALNFAQEVERRAAVLSRLGISRQSIVAILHNNSARFFSDLFAIWRLGAAAACLDSELTDEEVQRIIGFAKPEVLLVDGRSRPIVGSVPILELNTASSSNVFAPAVAAVPDDRALVLFTSGTTAEPKGVVLSSVLCGEFLKTVEAASNS